MAPKILPTSPNQLPSSGWLGGEPKEDVLPASPNTLPSGGWVGGSPKSDVLPASPNKLVLSSGWVDNPIAPVVIEPLPIGAEKVDPHTTLTFRVKQIKAIADIDIDTLDVYFSYNNGPQIAAVINNVDQNSYSHSTVDESTSLESIYFVEVTPPTGIWLAEAEIDTYVEIEDTAP